MKELIRVRIKTRGKILPEEGGVFCLTCFSISSLIAFLMYIICLIIESRAGVTIAKANPSGVLIKPAA